jgi:response regulator RpfG family c-di-GMP phosphodiesterase
MGKKYHILVADDEPSVREVLRDLILALGDEYQVYAAADSFEALQMLHSLPLDLALIDIFMPGLNGFELLKEARGTYPKVMMVVITGQPSYKMVLEALRLGATDFLAKPISLAELRKILDKLKKEKAHPGNQPGRAGLNFEPNLEARTQEMHGKIQGQHFLHSLSEKLGALRSARELYPFLTGMAVTLTGASRAAYFLYDQKLGRLQMVSCSDLDPGAELALPLSHQIFIGDPGPSPFEARPQPSKPLPPPSLSLPLKLRGELLGVLQVHGQPGQQFKPESLSRLQLLVDRSLLTLENLTLHESFFANSYDTLKALINSLEARDPYSRHHSIRVTYIATHFAEKLQLAAELIDSLRLAGALHDIGKIGIPDAILLKPDILKPQEMDIIRQHPIIGDNIVAPLNLLPRERALILHHHERWDGKGYPMGLAGEDIPFLSRLIALGDSYDAITSDRPYRKRRTHEEALAEIAAHAGTQFDPDLAEQFVEIMSQPAAAREICGSAAEFEADQPFLPDQQFQLFKKNFNNTLLPVNGYKKSPADFPQQTAARSDI